VEQFPNASVFQGVRFFNSNKYSLEATQKFDRNNKPEGFETKATVTITYSLLPGSGFVQLPTELGGATKGIEGGGTLTAAPVPEPSTLALLGAGILSLLGYGWQHRKVSLTSGICQKGG